MARPDSSRRFQTLPQQPGTAAESSPLGAAQNVAASASSKARALQALLLRTSDTIGTAIFRDSRIIDQSAWLDECTVTHVGQGGSFLVRRMEPKSYPPPNTVLTDHKVFIVKSIRVDAEVSDDSTLWDAIDLEVRALLHSPFRSHRNIVTLIGLILDSYRQSATYFPDLVLEYATHGSLADFQASKDDPLPMRTKLQLCLDISRGLRILHECNVVHGDLKSENVLVFDDGTGGGYIAKLADFGSSFLESSNLATSLKVVTKPWEAPEYATTMNAESLKLTDVYSYGLLFWRTVMDGKNPFTLAPLWLTDIRAMDDCKRNSHFSHKAGEVLQSYIPSSVCEELDVCKSVFDFTLQFDPRHRNMDRAHAILERKLSGTENQFTDMRSLAGALPQNENVQPVTLPGLAFDIYELSHRLSWDVQVQFVEHFEEMANVPERATSSQSMSVGGASFSLFRCYLHGFGVMVDVNQACFWLTKAAQKEQEMALPLLWRFHDALRCPLTIPWREVMMTLNLAVVRGYKDAMKDMERMWETLTEEERGEAGRPWVKAPQLYRTLGCGAGLTCFLERNLRQNFHIFDPERLVQELDASPQSVSQVAVNNLGHGVLHYAAASGAVEAVKLLLDSYNCDINSLSTDGETPLYCACRSGHFETTQALLHRAANPCLGTHAGATPLHWASQFDEDKVRLVVDALKCAGGDLEAEGKVPNSGPEGIHNPAGTALLRAVGKNSLAAVHALLSAGADPLAGGRLTSPIAYAALLLLPSILDTLLTFVGAYQGSDLLLDRLPRLDEIIGIGSARSMHIENRVMLLGHLFRSNVFDTFAIFRRLPLSLWSQRDWQPKLSTVLHTGYEDIVEAALYHFPLGSSQLVGPLQKAVLRNHEPMVKILVDFGADVQIPFEDSQGRRFTLLQLLCQRLPYSRQNIGVAKFLIDRGIRIETASGGTWPALSLAILARNFDLADYLLTLGADINRILDTEYALPGLLGPINVTIFGRAAWIKKEEDASSFRYLIDKIKSQDTPPSSRPSFFIDSSNTITIFHAVAMISSRSSPDVIGTVTRTMMDLLLAIREFNVREKLDHAGEVGITALHVAAMSANDEAAIALLENDADPNLIAMGHFTALDILLLTPRTAPLDAQAAAALRDRISIIERNIRARGGRRETLGPAEHAVADT